MLGTGLRVTKVRSFIKGNIQDRPQRIYAPCQIIWFPSPYACTCLEIMRIRVVKNGNDMLDHEILLEPIIFSFHYTFLSIQWEKSIYLVRMSSMRLWRYSVVHVNAGNCVILRSYYLSMVSPAVTVMWRSTLFSLWISW